MDQEAGIESRGDPMSCLSCEELETKICALAEELAGAEGCAGQRIQEAGIQFDYSAQLTSKQKALDTYRELYAAQGCNSSTQLYEFVHTACPRPAVCTGNTCRTRKMHRTIRRYRR